MSGLSFGSPGTCIFCGVADTPRTREHIIPKAIAGGPDGLVFTDATCGDCQVKIKRFEDHSHLVHLIGARRFLDLRGYTKVKNQKTHLPMRATTGTYEGTVMVAVEDYPALLGFPVYGPASWQTDPEAALVEPPVTAMTTRLLRGDDGRLNRKYGIKTFTGMMFDAGLLGRYIAKVAHCYTIGRFGLENVVPFLGPHLLHEDLAHRGILPFIGNSDRKIDVPGLHRLETFEKKGLGYHLVGGVVQLFGQADMPTYEVLVGAMKGSKLPPWAQVPPGIAEG